MSSAVEERIVIVVCGVLCVESDSSVMCLLTEESVCFLSCSVVFLLLISYGFHDVYNFLKCRCVNNDRFHILFVSILSKRIARN